MEIITILLKLKLTKQAKVDVIIKQVNIKRVRAKKTQQESHISFLCLAIQMSFIFHALHNILYIHTPLIKSIVANNTLREMAQLFFLIFSLFFTFKKEISSKKKKERKESIKFHVLKSRKPRYQITFTVE